MSGCLSYVFFAFVFYKLATSGLSIEACVVLLFASLILAVWDVSNQQQYTTKAVKQLMKNDEKLLSELLDKES